MTAILKCIRQKVPSVSLSECGAANQLRTWAGVPVEESPVTPTASGERTNHEQQRPAHGAEAASLPTMRHGFARRQRESDVELV